MPLRTLLCLLLVAGWRTALALDFALVSERPQAVAGEPAMLILIVTNEGQETATFQAPALIGLRMVLGEGERTLNALREPGHEEPVEIAPEGFVRIRYRLMPPADTVGDLLLQPLSVASNPVALRVLPEGTSAEVSARLTAALSPYEPMYFSVGSRGETTARYQISLKFRVFNPNTTTPLLEKIYLGYSQASLWDLDSNSKPFRDSSYRPSIFFLDENVSQWPFSGSRLGFQGGLEHESNGKDGDSSRSINIAFVRPALTIPLGGDYMITFAPKVYYYLDKEDNPDIVDFRGYADFLVRFGQEDGWLFDTTYRRGTGSGKRSVQVDATYPLRKPTFGNLGGYIHLQYFNGYGESLLDYNLKLRSQFRIGLMVTRGLRW
jgi:outer membrane phospholipase A